MAEALYRKYRPQVFEDVVGQEPIERTLKNAIDQDKVSHAYLFCGPRGTGKTTIARLLAKALLCQQGPTSSPDGTCDDCNLITEGAHPDVYELDAASRTGVENVREEIISRVQFAPTRGRYKVYIIDEVHMLSTAAFNALLKTLEEPPSHVVFVLCTTDPQKVPETIHSRCQRFDFRRIASESMVSRLGAVCMAEGVEFEGEALDLIAHRAEGGLRNALTSLEQIIAFEGGKVTLAGAERLLGSIDANDMAEIMAYVGKRDIANCFRWTAAYVETGADLAQFVRDMAEHVRNLYVMSLAGDDAVLEVSETIRRELVGELAWFGSDRLARLLGVLGDLSSELKTSSNPRLSFEIALTRMVRPDSDLTIESLAERIEALEAGYSAVAHVLPGPAVAIANAAPTVVSEPAPLSTAEQPAPAPQQVVAAQEPVATPAQEPARAQAVQAAQPQPAAVAVQAAQPQPAPEPAVREVEQAAPVQAAASPAPEGRIATLLANPASLQRTWQAALSTLKKQKASYGVLFLNTKTSYDEAAGKLNIVFAAENSFTYKTVQKPDVQDALAEAIASAFGAAVPFACVQAGSEPTASYAPAASAAPKAEPAPVAVEPQVAPKVEAAPEPVQPATIAPAEPEPAAPSPARAAEQAPYEEEYVPYEDEYVPYDDSDFDDPYAIDPYDGTAPVRGDAMGNAPAPVSGAFEPAAAAGSQPAVTTSATPEVPAETPTGLQPEESASDIEAMLQAGFGGGVVFEEVE